MYARELYFIRIAGRGLDSIILAQQLVRLIDRSNDHALSIPRSRVQHRTDKRISLKRRDPRPLVILARGMDTWRTIYRAISLRLRYKLEEARAWPSNRFDGISAIPRSSGIVRLNKRRERVLSIERRSKDRSIGRAGARSSPRNCPLLSLAKDETRRAVIRYLNTVTVSRADSQRSNLACSRGQSIAASRRGHNYAPASYRMQLGCMPCGIYADFPAEAIIPN